jgi:hypothetical protein
MQYQCVECKETFKEDEIEYEPERKNVSFLTAPAITEKGIPKCPKCGCLHFFGFEQIIDETEKCKCEECGAQGTLYLHARCHQDEPTWTILHQEKGELEIQCSVCEKTVARFKIQT